MEVWYYILLLMWWFFAWIYGSVVWSWWLISLPIVIFTWLPIHIAIATHRFWVVILELVSFIKYKETIKVDVKTGVIFWFLAALWAYIWSNIVLQLNESTLNYITAVLLIFVFGILILLNKLWLKNTSPKWSYWYSAMFFTVILWIYGSIFWAWFGTFIAFIFLLIGFDYTHSSALSRSTWFIMSLTASIIFAYNGLIYYPYGITLWLWFALWAWVWVWIGIKNGNKYIKYLFITLLVITVIKLIFWMT